MDKKNEAAMNEMAKKIEERAKGVLEDYESGMPIDAIAYKYHISERHVIGILKTRTLEIEE